MKSSASRPVGENCICANSVKKRRRAHCPLRGAGNWPSWPLRRRLTRFNSRELSLMRWGFPPPPNLGKVPMTNVRNLASPYWRGWLKAQWRCLVPATSFCEWTDSRPKVTNWFALDESRPLFAFAGIWRLWTGERKGSRRNAVFLFAVRRQAYQSPIGRNRHVARADIKGRTRN
jgi:hypothetical protein